MRYNNDLYRRHRAYISSGEKEILHGVGFILDNARIYSEHYPDLFHEVNTAA
jgi:hypothetical protein